jgi:hypothetical protein
MLVTSPGVDDPRSFIVGQHGGIRIFVDHKLLPELFLDISQLSEPGLIAGGEMGLLGMAFHPRFQENGEFFIYYTTQGTAPSFAVVVRRYTVDPANPNRADPDSATTVLFVEHRFGNHHGGMIEFGPDGMLYVSIGDGGGSGDPLGSGQDTQSLLGKILRIDVDVRGPGFEYGIPVDTPFPDGVGGAPEVFVYGLRNPWRFSFDDASGNLWIGDVGQGEREEIDVLRPNEMPGADLGWNMWEAELCFTPPCDATGRVFPIDARTHATDGWCSVIGGDVYRGRCSDELQGWFFYTDFCASELVRARLNADGTTEIVNVDVPIPLAPTSIHAGAFGELYLTDQTGGIWHLLTF